MKLSIIIPCYNEIYSIKKIIKKIENLKINSEIIIIDDGSNDGTNNVIRKLKSPIIKKKIFHKKNYGKGMAIISAVKYIKGDIVVIQDADLEYNPKDLEIMAIYLHQNKLPAVYGSRFLNKNNKKLNKIFLNKVRIYGNIFLTKISNIINKQKLTDAHTCYKMIDAKIFKKLNLKEKGFAFCAEVNTKLSNLKIPILELPIYYKGRGIKQGKKIKFSDFFFAIKAIIYYKLKKFVLQN